MQSSPNCALLPPMGGGDRRICPVKAGNSVLTPESLGCAFLCLVACVCQISLYLPMFFLKRWEKEQGLTMSGLSCHLKKLYGLMQLEDWA